MQPLEFHISTVQEGCFRVQKRQFKVQKETAFMVFLYNIQYLA